MAEKKMAAPEAVYIKEQVLESEMFKPDKDLLTVILDGEKQYSMADIKSAIARAKKERI